jgi:hypothetical protein
VMFLPLEVVLPLFFNSDGGSLVQGVFVLLGLCVF